MNNDSESPPQRTSAGICTADTGLVNAPVQDVRGSRPKERAVWDASPWKARQIAEILAKNGLRPRTVCEVGFGNGRVIKELSEILPWEVTFDGYDITREAFELSRQYESERVRYHLANVLEQDVSFDLLLVIDVFEHVADYLGFLRGLRQKAPHVVFHIPLDLSASSVIRPNSLLVPRRESGHLHYFTRGATALATLQDAGYVVIDYSLKKIALEVRRQEFLTRIANLGRQVSRLLIGDEMTQNLLGGYSLLVLADSRRSVAPG